MSMQLGIESYSVNQRGKEIMVGIIAQVEGTGMEDR